MAITNLANKESSPELRQWSVEILNKLAPIPLSKKLQDELTFASKINPRIPLPESAEGCPDIAKSVLQDAHANKSEDKYSEILFGLAKEYEACRLKHANLTEYISALNAIQASRPSKGN